jgi:hypothetical protein
MAGQTASTTKPPALPKPGPAPKTAWGEPDLQGTWFVMEQVPFERTQANANKPLLTDAEVEAADKAKASNVGRNARNANNAAQDVEGAYNAVFNSILRTSKRTSMIIDPPDGKIPPLTAEAQQRQGRGGGRGAVGGGGGGAVRAAVVETRMTTRRPRRNLHAASVFKCRFFPSIRPLLRARLWRSFKARSPWGSTWRMIMPVAETA